MVRGDKVSGCVLRAGGVRFSPEAFLMHSSLEVVEVFDSALHIGISKKAGNDLYGQIVDAMHYLQVNAVPLRHLTTYPGIDNATLDFCVWRQLSPAQSLVFPPQLIELAGRLGLGLAMSIYEVSEGDVILDKPVRKVIPFPHQEGPNLHQIAPTALQGTDNNDTSGFRA